MQVAVVLLVVVFIRERERIEKLHRFNDPKWLKDKKVLVSVCGERGEVIHKLSDIDLERGALFFNIVVPDQQIYEKSFSIDNLRQFFEEGASGEEIWGKLIDPMFCGIFSKRIKRSGLFHNMYTIRESINKANQVIKNGSTYLPGRLCNHSYDSLANDKRFLKHCKISAEFVGEEEGAWLISIESAEGVVFFDEYFGKNILTSDILKSVNVNEVFSSKYFWQQLEVHIKNYGIDVGLENAHWIFRNAENDLKNEQENSLNSKVSIKERIVSIKERIVKTSVAPTELSNVPTNLADINVKIAQLFTLEQEQNVSSIQVHEESFNSKVITRMGCDLISQGMKEIILGIIKKKFVEEGFIKEISLFMDGEVGEAVLSCILGLGLPYMRMDSEMLDKFSHEFMIQGVEKSGRMIFKEFMQGIVPILEESLGVLEEGGVSSDVGKGELTSI